MKRLIFAVVASLVVPSIAYAQTSEKGNASLNILFGYIGVRDGQLDPDNGDFKTLGGALIGVNVVTPLTHRVSLNMTFGGFKTESSVTDFPSGDTVGVKTRNISIEPVFRFYAGPAGKPRGFFEAGPTLNFVRAEALVDVTGLPFINESESGTKLGGVFGGGVDVPMTPRFGFEAVAQYALIPEFSGLNLSNLRLLGGFTIQLGKVK